MTYVANPEEALRDANVCFVFTEWGEIKAVQPETYRKLMRTPLVFDGRNIYNVDEMKQAGIEYHSVGRKSAERVRAKELVENDLQKARS